MPLELLLAHLLLLGFGGRGLGERLLLLQEDDLDVARRRHVRIDATVGPVRPTPHMGSPVHLNGVDDQVVGVQTLVLGVALRVLQEVEEELGRLLGPATLRRAVDFSLGVTSDAAHEAPEGDDFLLVDDVLQVGGGAVQRHLLDGLSRLAGVL